MSEKKEVLEKAAVMMAFVEGKTIEYAFKSCDNWKENKDPCWNWGAYKYRVKPEPPRKFVRYYVCVINTGNLLGGFITKEAAEISCASYNRGCKVPEFNVVAFELTEIK